MEISRCSQCRQCMHPKYLQELHGQTICKFCVEQALVAKSEKIETNKTDKAPGVFERIYVLIVLLAVSAFAVLAFLNTDPRGIPHLLIGLGLFYAVCLIFWDGKRS